MAGEDQETPRIIVAGKGWDPKKIKEVAEKTKVGEGVLPEPAETKVRFGPPGMSVRDLYNTAVFGKEEEERNSAYGELHRRIKTAEDDMSIGFNRQVVKDTLVQTLEESTWDNFYRKLLVRGSNQENEAQGVTSYKDQRLGGLMNMIYQMTADVASAQGAINKLGEDDVDRLAPDQKKWLTEKMGGTDDALEVFNRRNAAIRANVLTLIGFSPDVNLAELVGKHPKSEGEADYDAAKREGKPRYEVPQFENDEIRKEYEEFAKEETRKMNEMVERLVEGLGTNIDYEREINYLIENGQDARSYILGIMDKIEESAADWTQSENLGKMFLRLENSLGIIDKNKDKLGDDLRKEIEARIKVYDSSRLMKRSGLWIEQNPGGDINIGAAVITAKIRRHLIENEEARFFLFGDYQSKTERRDFLNANGTKFKNPNDEEITLNWNENTNGDLTTSEGTSMAWDLLEKINSWKYRDVLRLIYEKEEEEKREKRRKGEATTPPVRVEDFYKELYQTQGEGNRKQIRYYDVTLDDGNHVRRAMPEVVNFFQDGDNERRGKVKGLVIAQLSGTGYTENEKVNFRKELIKSLKGRGIAEDQLEGIIDAEIKRREDFAWKSVRLAESMAIATIETSRWNTQMKGGGRLFIDDERYGENDQPAECEHFREWRVGRPKRDRGIEVTIPMIPGFGDSCLGMNTKKVIEITDMNWALDRNRGPYALYTEYFDEDNVLEKMSLTNYAAIVLRRNITLKNELVKESFDPGKDLGITETSTSIEALKKNVVLFTNANKTLSAQRQAELDLAAIWVYHIHEFASSETGKAAGWNPNTLEQLRRAVCEKPLAEYLDPYDIEQQELAETGQLTFINKEQWKAIEQLSDPYRITTFLREFKPYADNFFPSLFGGSSGGKKR